MDLGGKLLTFLNSQSDLSDPRNKVAISRGSFDPLTIQRLRSVVRRHGRSYPIKSRRYAVPTEQRKCFKYAQNLAVREGVGYVEGFALGNQPFLGSLPGGLAYFHAWCVDSDGYVIDPQWRNYGAAYFGIEFTRSYLIERFQFFQRRFTDQGIRMIPFLCAEDFDETSSFYVPPGSSSGWGCCGLRSEGDSGSRDVQDQMLQA